MIRRPPRSTQSRSSAASDVYKRQRHTLAADTPCCPLRYGWPLSTPSPLAHSFRQRRQRDCSHDYERERLLSPRFTLHCFVDNDDCHGLGSRKAPEDRAQLAKDGWNTCAPRKLSLHCLDLGSVARVLEPNTLDAPYDRLVDKCPDALLRDTHGSRPVEHVDDTVLEREDRFDLQDAGCHACRLADAPALDDILHCVDEKVDMRARTHPVQPRDGVVDAGSALNKLDGLHDHEPESKSCHPHIVEMDASGISLLGCNVGTVECSTRGGRQVNAQLFVARVCEQPGVNRDEILGAGLCGARLCSSFLLRVENISRYLHKLPEKYSVDRNFERHNGKVVLFGKTSGKAACGVRYNVNSHKFPLVENRGRFDDAHVLDKM